MDAEETKRRFIQLANSWNVGSRLLIRRYLAIRTSDGWQLQYAINIISGDLTGEIRKNPPLPLRIETNSLLSVRETTALTKRDVAGLIKKIETEPCVLHLSEDKLSILQNSESNASYYLDPVGHPQFPRRQRLPTLTASLSSAEVPRSLIDRRLLDLELNACSTPFYGLDDLCGELSFPQSVFDASRGPLIEWVIVPPAIIESDSNLADGKARIAIKCDREILPDDLTCGYRFFSKNGATKRGQVRGDQMTWHTIDSQVNAECVVEANEAAFGNLFLVYQGENLDLFWLKDQRRYFNEKLAVHELFDRQKIIGDSFFDRNDNQFEDLVAILLELLGFSVVKYGAAISDAPDILAYSPHGHLLVIECTTAGIGKEDKLLKLHRRTQIIREAKDSHPSDLSVIQPIMITKYSREETKAHWDEARGFEISLVCREELEWLINRVDAPPSIQQLIEAAMNCIPNRNTIPE
ncbi:MAG: hypothetical protein HOM58_11015 [Rhodospirillaceae bacterium]|jgi:hypothetical protein|nr:hypothetical protein [Rhodospirillaceae bacterium]MBT5456930.1 hypothetical protein [Rhodospirillaceae bacterium]